MATRVLVVDDDPATCELIRDVLVSAEIDCLALTRSERAIGTLATEKFDAIFLDVNMPAPDGIELTQKIRSGGLNLSTPIMVITGEDDRGLLALAFSSGANYFLYKPVDRRDILRLLRATHGSIENEKRRFRRVKIQCKVSISCGSARVSGSTLDISLGGAFVQASHALPLGSVARASIDLKSEAPLTVSARVVRVAGEDCMAMQFENLGVKEAKRLQDFLLPLLPKTE
jgi:DNA-binding response OmpR family regulator